LQAVTTALLPHWPVRTDGMTTLVATPVGDVRTAKATVHAASGKTPNMMVVGKQVHDKLLDHPDILERIKYTQRGVVTEDILARLFEVDKYVIGKALYDSSQEGGTESLAYVWGKNVALVLCRSFTWNQASVLWLSIPKQRFPHQEMERGGTGR